MKKYLPLFILGLLFASQAHAALLFVSTSTASSTSSGATTTASITTTVNNLLVLSCVQTGGGSDFSTSTASSSDGIIFTKFAEVSSSAFGTMSNYYSIASTTAAITVSCVYGGASLDRIQGIAQYSGNATTSILDTSSSKVVAASITSSSDLFSTTNSNDVIVSYGYANSDGALTSVQSPFLARFLKAGLFGFGQADLITSTVQVNKTSTWTFSASPWVNVIGSFKAAPPNKGSGEGQSHFNVGRSLTIRKPVNIDQ